MNETNPTKNRSGFTLVELLVAIAIIGVMAGMVLFSLAGAQEDAKTTRTIGTIQKINDVILQRWEEYRYRAVKLNVPPEWLLPQASLSGQPLLGPREGARLRMIALRDTMRMEMPDRFTDLIYPPTRYGVVLNGASSAIYSDATGLGRAVPQEYNQLREYFGFAPLSGAYVSTAMSGTYPYIPREDTRLPGVPTLSYDNQQAELLYAIVALSSYGGGSALEQFRPSEIGDTDGDGYLEFLDAWGTPIRWLRWPAGVQTALNGTYSVQDTNGQPHAPDAMDPVHTDWRWTNAPATPATPLPYPAKPWTLVPLIVSAGPDREFDILFDPADNSGAPIFAYAGETFDTAPGMYGSIRYFNVDPYLPVPAGTVGNSTALYIGSTFDNADVGTDNFNDNITSHALLLE